MTGPIVGLHFRRYNSAVMDTTHSLIQFPHLTMQLRSTANETNAKAQAFLTDEALTFSPMTTKLITASVDHPSERKTTGTMTPLEKFTKAANLLNSHSM